MVQLIMGLKGSGKTKRLVEMVATAVREESGSVVCIEKDKKLTYDIPYQARLIYACDYAYAMGSYDFFKGFLSGLHAGNYDITHVFVDNFTKMLSEVSEQQIAEFLAWLNDFSEREHIQFTLSLSMDPATTGSEITKYRRSEHPERRFFARIIRRARGTWPQRRLFLHFPSRRAPPPSRCAGQRRSRSRRRP